MQWLRNGTCLVEGCRFNHKIPQNAKGYVQTKVGVMKNLDMIVTPPVWKHLNEVNSEQFITDNNLVLLDSGSNEVVRSYSGWEWQQILDKKPHTKRIRVGLALNQIMDAGITMGGELMRAPPKYGPQNIPKQQLDMSDH